MVTQTTKDEVKMIFSEIEAGIRRLVEENARLRAQIAELSQPKEDLSWREKIISVEEEMKKFRKTMEEYQKQERINRDRIFHIRRLIQEEFNSKTGPVKEELKEDLNSPAPLPDKETTWEEEEEAVGYSPYIATDEEEPITHWPLEGEDSGEEIPFLLGGDKKDPPASMDKEKEVNKEEVVEKKSPQDPNRVDRAEPEIPVEENPNSFLINDFTQEKDPFGDEDSKMEDDDFFKSRGS